MSWLRRPSRPPFSGMRRIKIWISWAKLIRNYELVTGSIPFRFDCFYTNLLIKWNDLRATAGKLRCYISDISSSGDAQSLTWLIFGTCILSQFNIDQYPVKYNFHPRHTVEYSEFLLLQGKDKLSHTLHVTIKMIQKSPPSYFYTRQKQPRVPCFSRGTLHLCLINLHLK